MTKHLLRQRSDLGDLPTIAGVALLVGSAAAVLLHILV
jgi:hypothetical protein